MKVYVIIGLCFLVFIGGLGIATNMSSMIVIGLVAFLIMLIFGALQSGADKTMKENNDFIASHGGIKMTQIVEKQVINDEVKVYFKIYYNDNTVGRADCFTGTSLYNMLVKYL